MGITIHWTVLLVWNTGLSFLTLEKSYIPFVVLSTECTQSLATLVSCGQTFFQHHLQYKCPHTKRFLWVLILHEIIPVKSRSTFAVSSYCSSASSKFAACTGHHHHQKACILLYKQNIWQTLYIIWQMIKAIGGKQPIAELRVHRLIQPDYILVHLFLHEQRWCMKLIVVFSVPRHLDWSCWQYNLH